MGTDVSFERFAQQTVDLGRSEMIDHVDHPRIAKRIATLSCHVTQCGEKMRLPRSRGPDQDGTAVLLDEIAVE